MRATWGHLLSAIEGLSEICEVVAEHVGPPCVRASSWSSPTGGGGIELEDRAGWCQRAYGGCVPATLDVSAPEGMVAVVCAPAKLLVRHAVLPHNAKYLALGAAIEPEEHSKFPYM